MITAYALELWHLVENQADAILIFNSSYIQISQNTIPTLSNLKKKIKRQHNL